MFFGFKPKNNSQPILVIEIESGSVACALVLINPAHAVCPTIKYYERSNFSYDPKNAGENSRDFFNLLFGTIEKTVTTVFKQIKKDERPVAIHCFSGSPLYLSQTRHLHLAEEIPFKVTAKLVKGLIDDQLASAMEIFPFVNPVLGNDEIEIIESKLVKIYLNGYEVADPYKLKAKKLELVHFSSLASSKIIKRIELILSGFYPELTPSWHSIAFALFNGITVNPKSLPNMIIVSTGGLNTEIIVIKDRVINEIVSVPFGEGSVAQGREQKLNIEDIKNEWHKNFAEGLKALTISNFLARNLLVVGHGALSETIAGWIKVEDFAKTTASQSTIHSISLSPDYFGNKCHYQSGSPVAEDIHLMAEIIFCDTLIKQGQNV